MIKKYTFQVLHRIYILTYRTKPINSIKIEYTNLSSLLVYRDFHLKFLISAIRYGFLFTKCAINFHWLECGIFESDARAFQTYHM